VAIAVGLPAVGVGNISGAAVAVSSEMAVAVGVGAVVAEAAKTAVGIGVTVNESGSGAALSWAQPASSNTLRTKISANLVCLLRVFMVLLLVWQRFGAGRASPLG
jgi:hypothetical protein